MGSSLKIQGGVGHGNVYYLSDNFLPKLYQSPEGHGRFPWVQSALDILKYSVGADLHNKWRLFPTLKQLGSSFGFRLENYRKLPAHKMRGCRIHSDYYLSHNILDFITCAHVEYGAEESYTQKHVMKDNGFGGLVSYHVDSDIASFALDE
ncbi:hypothetical protein BX666DRAFT_1876845 [Dichotomocladium elegans]|nr:hypothetical protein BX666DRAFT_1876845 [Dichotomocladium elegans]